MHITHCHIAGLAFINLAKNEDERGFFARSYCHNEYLEAGLNPKVVQCNFVFTRFSGTVRGMHYQIAPKEESKTMRCVRGAILDVAVDLRTTSPTFLEHVAIELSADNRTAFYVPEGFAHGYQTLCDDTEVSYQVSEYYSPDYEMGLRYDDPTLEIRWALPVEAVSPKDANWPLLSLP